MFTLIHLHFAFTEIHRRDLVFPDFWGNYIKDSHNFLFEIMAFMIPVHWQKQRFTLLNLYKLPKYRIMLSKDTIKHIINFVAGMQVRRVIGASRPQLPGPYG